MSAQPAHPRAQRGEGSRGQAAPKDGAGPVGNVVAAFAGYQVETRTAVWPSMLSSFEGSTGTLGAFLGMRVRFS